MGIMVERRRGSVTVALTWGGVQSGEVAKVPSDVERQMEQLKQQLLDAETKARALEEAQRLAAEEAALQQVRCSTSGRSATRCCLWSPCHRNTRTVARNVGGRHPMARNMH